MVPGGEWRRVREALNVVGSDAAIRTSINRARDEIVLIVAPQEQLLAIRQIEIEASDVGVQLSRRARIEAKAAGVETVADGRVVGRISLRRSGQHGECLWVNARDRNHC
jgi:hypothetical protein